MTQEINNECWRNVSGYLNYQISNVGRVRNSFTGLILKQHLRKNNYYQISLYKDKKSKSFYTHRLVAQEFIDNPEERPFVDHINRDTKHNCMDNLRWVSISQNNMNSTKSMNCSSIYKGVSFDKSKNKWKAYIQIGGNLKNLGRYENERDAALRYNVEAVKLFGENASLNVISDNEEEEETEDVDEDEDE